MNVVFARAGVVGKEYSGIVDAAHAARVMVADTVRSGARAKLEGSAGGQRWWVIDTA